MNRCTSGRRKLSAWAIALVAMPMALALAPAPITAVAAGSPWKALADVPYPRYDLASAVDGAGRVYAIGGSSLGQ
ncbi:MAG: hypothetical protein ABR532_03440, partial [Candidatus Dormibacteria bacterium]